MDIEKAVMRQRRFFESGRTKDYAFRRTALLKLQAGIQTYEKEFIKALQKDLRKSETESYLTEIGLIREELTHTLSHLRGWMGAKRVPTPFYQFPACSYTLAEPYGVTLIMAPWNYPVLLCLQPLISAIAAGNCVVLKPSPYAPASTKVLVKMLGELYPAKYILVVEGGAEAGERLLDCRFDKIFFTGGVATGRKVLAKAAEHMTPVTLELGGKNPCIVDKTANLRLAAKRIVFGKILNSGQTCVAPDYLIIYDSVKEEFLKHLKRELRGMLGKNPLKNPDYPRMVNAEHYLRVMQLMGNEHICIGGYGDSEALQIAPTVLDEVTLDSPVMQEEIFGPVLPVLTVSTVEEILSIVRHFEKPLACYIFTKNPRFKGYLMRNLSFGGCCVNDVAMQVVSTHLKFGGVGKSGMGSYHGKCGYDSFSHQRGVMERGTWWDNPLRYQPYSEKKLKWIRRVFGRQRKNCN